MYTDQASLRGLLVSAAVGSVDIAPRPAVELPALTEKESRALVWKHDQERKTHDRHCPE